MIVTTFITMLCLLGSAFCVQVLMALRREPQSHHLIYWVRVHLEQDEHGVPIHHNNQTNVNRAA